VWIITAWQCISSEVTGDCEGSNAVDMTDNMLWNDNQEDEHVRSECGEGTDCDGGDNDTDW
jgi:hypothetical protein